MTVARSWSVHHQSSKNFRKEGKNEKRKKKRKKERKKKLLIAKKFRIDPVQV